MSEAKQIIPMQVWAILDPERYIKKPIKDWSLAIYDERGAAVRQIESISRANREECLIEELAICNKVKLVDYIKTHNEMYEMLEKVLVEYKEMLGVSREVNEIESLLEKARGEQ